MNLALRFLLIDSIICSFLLFLCYYFTSSHVLLLFVSIYAFWRLFIDVYFATKDSNFLAKRYVALQTDGNDIDVYIIVIALFIALFIGIIAMPIPEFSNFTFFGLLLEFSSQLLIFIALLQNPYAYKHLGIHENQFIVTSGVYSYFRHPQYLGAIMFLFSVPFIFSYLTLLPVLLAIYGYSLRIEKEEKLLSLNFDSYVNYQKNTFF